MKRSKKQDKDTRINAPVRVYLHDLLFGIKYTSEFNITGNDTEYIRADLIPSWHRAKAGRDLKEDCLIINDGENDARIGRCAVNGCRYLSINDLLDFFKEIQRPMILGSIKAAITLENEMKENE